MSTRIVSGCGADDGGEDSGVLSGLEATTQKFASLSHLRCARTADIGPRS